MEKLEWLAPQPLWDALDLGDASAVRGPVIARFTSDDFMESFLATAKSGAMGGLDLVDAGGGADSLFLPFHGHYHLVVASLVCNRLGFPDRTPDPKEGERVGFVLRRGSGAAGGEAWIPGTGWRSAAADALAEGEEVLPLVRAHSGERTLWHGFLPLSSGEAIGSGETVESKFGPTPDAELYHVRCVYLRPGCRHERELLSESSVAFKASTFLDPAAPQRPVEIGLDVGGTLNGMAQSITFKLKNHTVGVLDKVIDNLPGDFPALDKGGLDCDSPSLSIPWITLVAFILLMIITAILWPIFALFAVPLSWLLPGGTFCSGSGGIPEREE